MQGRLAAVLALPVAAAAPVTAQGPRGSDGSAGTDVGAAVPDWHREHLAYLSRGSGRWTTDNAAYRSAVEPVTEYYLRDPLF